MAGINTRNLDNPFEGRIVGWFSTGSRAFAQIMEDKRRRGEPLDDDLPDAILAVTSSHRLAVMARSTDERRNSGVSTMDRRTAKPR